MPLRNLAATYTFETAKAARWRVTWVLLALPVAVTALVAWWLHVSRAVSGAIAGEEPTAVSGYYYFAKSAAGGLGVGGVVLLLYATMVFSNEGHWGTYKTILLRPVSRLSIVAGKFGLVLSVAAAMLVFVAATAWSAGQISGQFGDVAEEGYVIYDSAFMLRESLRAFGLVAAPFAALCAFGLFFSALTDHAGLAAAGGLGSLVILETAKSSLPESKLYFFNSFVPSLADTSSMRVLSGLSEGLSDANWEQGVARYALVTPLITAIVFFGLTALVFCRRNFAK